MVICFVRCSWTFCDLFWQELLDGAGMNSKYSTQIGWSVVHCLVISCDCLHWWWKLPGNFTAWWNVFCPLHFDRWWLDYVVILVIDAWWIDSNMTPDWILMDENCIMFIYIWWIIADAFPCLSCFSTLGQEDWRSYILFLIILFTHVWNLG